MPWTKGESNSVLLLKKMQSHIQLYSIDSVADTNAQVIEMLGGLTSVSQNVM